MLIRSKSESVETIYNLSTIVKFHTTCRISRSNFTIDIHESNLLEQPPPQEHRV